VANKWRQIAGTTKSKLVTLPDMNFAYTVVDVENNKDLINEIIEKLLSYNLYHTIKDG